jgi:hypothetical protein
MPLHMVDVNSATPLRRPKGSQVTLVNTSNVVVYFDINQNYLNSFAPGSVPNTAFLPAAAAGPPVVPGSVQFDDFPGVIWTRSVTQTTIQVYP